MKKLILLFGLLLAIGCTAEEIKDNDAQQIDPEKICPPNDRNCDGCPDDQEPCE